MSIVENDPALQPFYVVPRLFTVADLEELPAELPSGPIDYELDNGRLVFIMVPPGDIHGAAQSNIVTQLKVQGELKGHGKARTEVGVVLWRDPDRVVTPDVLFIANKSMPIRRSPEGYLETIPELVVEVRSKNDSGPFIERKVEHYLKAGVEIIWVIDTTTKAVAIHRSSAPRAILDEADTLELPNLIPGFTLPVAEIFRD
jgi:Uma2 family endonuclease